MVTHDLAGKTLAPISTSLARLAGFGHHPSRRRHGRRRSHGHRAPCAVRSCPGAPSSSSTSSTPAGLGRGAASMTPASSSPTSAAARLHQLRSAAVGSHRSRRSIKTKTLNIS